MKRRVSVVVGVFAVLCLVPAFATLVSAHHSFAAEFDGTKPVTLKGTITQMKWVNPHSWLYIDVKGSDGKVVNWALEFGLPQALYRRGWTKKDLPVGQEVTIQGFLAKDGTPTANAQTVTLSDGRRLFAGSSGTGAPGDGGAQ